MAATQSILTLIGVAYAIFGLSLLFQPGRWGSTPAYADLLHVAPQDVWGDVFLACAACAGLAVLLRSWRWLTVAALTANIMITTGWALAFVVRYITSAHTTPETWVSWVVFDYLLIRAALLLDYSYILTPVARHRHGEPPQPQE